MAINSMWLDVMGASDPNSNGVSVTATITLAQPSYAAAQVTLTRAAYFDTPGWDQCYIIGYSENGNPVDLSNAPPEYLIIQGATSFTFRADAFQGAVTALMNVFIAG